MDFFEDQLYRYFHLTPTKGQEILFKKFSKFIEYQHERCIFLLKGYAGTGKTTVLDAIIKAAPSAGYSISLMAPTGRAAKVMNHYTGRFASTIHRKIYSQKEDAYTGNLTFQLLENKDTNTLYLIDEASMISEVGDWGNNGLLWDLFTYVFQGENNKLVLIGDEAQLPPIGLEMSPALEKNHLEGRYHAKVYHHTLTEVMRQDQQSGILHNATQLRNLLPIEKINIQLETKGFPDFYKLSGERLEDGIRYAYDKYGQENTIIITQSNKNAVLYNRLIRNNIHYFESEVEQSDVLMVVKNNYNTLSAESQAGFLANGEFVRVKRLGREEEMHGFRFQKVTLALLDYPDDPEFDTYIHLDLLYTDTPSLSQEDNKNLYESVIQDYSWVKSKKERNKLIRQDKYYNALQVKFAYALTCHKAQGGQWDAVFVDRYFLRDNIENLEFLRWLYTAITRGVKEVFLINFPDYLFNKQPIL